MYYDYDYDYDCGGYLSVVTGVKEVNIHIKIRYEYDHSTATFIKAHSRIYKNAAQFDAMQCIYSID